LQEGGKMSKSKGNVMYADDLADVFGVDAVRYFLLSEMPYDNDGLISWELVTENINSDLANTFGNLVKRTVSMINQYQNGVLMNTGVSGDADAELKAVAAGAYEKVKTLVDAFRVSDAVQEVMSVFRRANKYIDETAPWVLAKDESRKSRLSTVLYNLAESIVIGASLMECVLPKSAAVVLSQIGVKARKFSSLSEFGLLKNGTKVTALPQTVFQRFDGKEVAAKVDVMYNKTDTISNNALEVKEIKMEEVKSENNIITIDEFFKTQLKVAEVLACEKVEKSDKLLKLTVLLGEETRTVVSGIAQWYAPESMVGRKVVLVANLAPAKLRGIVSEGMILCADDGNGGVVLVSPEKDVKSGSTVR